MLPTAYTIKPGLCILFVSYYMAVGGGGISEWEASTDISILLFDCKVDVKILIQRESKLVYAHICSFSNVDIESYTVWHLPVLN